MSRYRLILTASLLIAAGCGAPADPTLNDVVPIADPRVDDTPPSAPFRPGQRRDVADADVQFDSPEYNQFISGVSMPGDLDGDGHGDLVLWSHAHADPDLVDCRDGCPGFERLVVYITYGGPHFARPGALRPDATLVGWYLNGARSWIEPAGDLDGDGKADVLLGITGDCQQGNVFTLFGGARLRGVMEIRDLPGVLRESDACSGFGFGTGVGDLDADGFDDFVVTAPDAGETYVFYGSATRPSARRSEAEADATFFTDLEEGIGPARPVGDVDGDRHADLLIANAPDRTTDESPGTWHLVLGGERLVGRVRIEASSTRLRAAMARGLGDLDGDGRDEIGVSLNATGDDAYVLPGRATWPAAVDASEGVLHIARSAVGASTALRPAGDVNGDGHPDFVYTDSRDSGDDAPRGAVHLFVGPHRLEARSLELSTSTAFLGQRWVAERDGSTQRGYYVLGDWSWRSGDGFAGGSDLVGDGRDDIAVVGRRAPESGRLYNIRGR